MLHHAALPEGAGAAVELDLHRVPLVEHEEKRRFRLRGRPIQALDLVQDRLDPGVRTRVQAPLGERRRRLLDLTTEPLDAVPEFRLLALEKQVLQRHDRCDEHDHHGGEPGLQRHDVLLEAGGSRPSGRPPS
jgi:hypothetical protein